MRKIFKSAVLVAALLVSSNVNAAPAGWDAFVIRNANSGGTPPTIVENYGGDPNAVQVIENLVGQKAALGTNLISGSTIGQIDTLSIVRNDDYSRFTAGSGPNVAPYMNFWVKDLLGNYAVLANEPSNPEWAGPQKWNTTGANLASKTVKVFEKHPLFVMPPGITLGAGGLTNGTFADFAGYTIEAPSAVYLAAGNGTGSGAPDELGTNLAYGFNWVLGDTGGNYLSDTNGFILSNPVASVVPEPATLSLIGSASLLLTRRRRAA
ncbi:MAG TPA: PEP-CTERM sorting domain-containing protein [Candidatus Paceibacterota bacterium]|nr:PEP-CTERM sorting domain-containing protein [Candidatus Paceibacterota bacterium]